MSMDRCNSCSLSFKVLFGTLVVLGFILVGTLQSEGSKTTLRIVDGEDESWSWKGKLLRLLQREEQVQDLSKGKSGWVHQPMDLNYTSKRRVPNGPDPIHNRRTGNSRRPPRHA